MAHVAIYIDDETGANAQAAARARAEVAAGGARRPGEARAPRGSTRRARRGRGVCSLLLHLETGDPADGAALAAVSGIDTISADFMGQRLAAHPLYDGAGAG